MRNKQVALATLGFAIFLSCADNPSLEFPSEKEAHQRYSNFSSTETSSSSLKTAVSSSSKTPSSSSSLPPSSPSSSSVCTASNNTNTHYCSGGTMKEYDFMTDNDGRTYKTVEISYPEGYSEIYQQLYGDPPIWMAENLNYNVSSSVCYEERESNCDKYGRLYNWATAMALPDSCNSDDCASQIDARRHRGICPSGWHLPSEKEWKTLVAAAGGGTSLKANSGWEPFQEQSGNGTDARGFAALPGGGGNADGNFFAIGEVGYLWTASDNGILYPNSAVHYIIFHINTISVNISSSGGLKSSLLSVRCVKD